MKHYSKYLYLFVIVVLVLFSAYGSLKFSSYEKSILHIANVLTIITSSIVITATIFVVRRKESITIYIKSILEARHYHTFIGPHLSKIDALIKGQKPNKAWLTGAIAELKSLYIHIQNKSYFNEKIKAHFEESINFLDQEHGKKSPNYGKSVIKIRTAKSYVEEAYFSPNIEVPNEQDC